MLNTSWRLYQETRVNPSILARFQQAVSSALTEPAGLKRAAEALQFAMWAHRDQFRADGVTPYVEHPIEVATLCAELGLDCPSVCAALLHDTVEDNPQEVTLDDLRQLFGGLTSMLVNGVTKIPRDRVVLQEQVPVDEAARVATMRKMLAGSEDVRVLLIKLADRTHNLRTIGSLKTGAQKRICWETLNFFAPLAERLGVWILRRELEDQSFITLEPESAHNLQRPITTTLRASAGLLEDTLNDYRTALANHGIQVTIKTQQRHLYELFTRREQKRQVDLNRLFDLLSVVIIPATVDECYATLGVLHSIGKPVERRFADFISHPRPNLYAALHTTIVDPKALEAIRIVIRTPDMDRSADYGLATLITKGLRRLNETERLALRRLRDDLHRWLNPSTSTSAFLYDLRQAVKPALSELYLPGRTMLMPNDATITDVAFEIGAETGLQCVRCRVDRTPRPLDYRPKRGDFIELETAPSIKPSLHITSRVTTATSRRHISQHFKREIAERSRQAGKRMLQQLFHSFGMNPSEQLLQHVAPRLKLKSLDQLYLALGNRWLSPLIVAHYAGKLEMPVLMPDIQRMTASCCRPVPGDSVYQIFTNPAGNVLHRVVCSRMLDLGLKQELQPPKYWAPDGYLYHFTAQVLAPDETGLLDQMGAVTESLHIETQVEAYSKRGLALIWLRAEVKDLQSALQVLTGLAEQSACIKVTRRGEVDVHRLPQRVQP